MLEARDASYLYILLKLLSPGAAILEGVGFDRALPLWPDPIQRQASTMDPNITTI